MAAFEHLVQTLRSRVRGLGFRGPATFYVWYDEQAGQLRCSTSSRSPSALPFRGLYVPTDVLGPILERFLAGEEPALILWDELSDAADDVHEPADEAVPAPFPVWTCSIGPAM